MLTLAFTSGSKALNRSTSTAPSLRATWRSRSLMKLSADLWIWIRPGLPGASVQMKTRAPRRRASPASSRDPGDGVRDTDDVVAAGLFDVVVALLQHDHVWRVGHVGGDKTRQRSRRLLAGQASVENRDGLIGVACRQQLPQHRWIRGSRWGEEIVGIVAEYRLAIGQAVAERHDPRAAQARRPCDGHRKGARAGSAQRIRGDTLGLRHADRKAGARSGSAGDRHGALALPAFGKRVGDSGAHAGEGRDRDRRRAGDLRRIRDGWWPAPGSARSACRCIPRSKSARAASGKPLSSRCLGSSAR